MLPSPKNPKLHGMCFLIEIIHSSQLTKHLDEACNEYEMICPMKEERGCDYKVRHVHDCLMLNLHAW